MKDRSQAMVLAEGASRRNRFSVWVDGTTVLYQVGLATAEMDADDLQELANLLQRGKKKLGRNGIGVTTESFEFYLERCEGAEDHQVHLFLDGGSSLRLDLDIEDVEKMAEVSAKAVARMKEERLV